MEPGYSFKRNPIPSFDPGTFKANRTLWNLMGNCRAIDGDEEIVITGQVLADGRGDWAAIRKIQKTLQKMFIGRTVRIIASSAEKWQEPGLLDISNIKALDLIFHGNSSRCGAIVPPSAFKANLNVIEKVQKAGVVISAGVDISSVFQSIMEETHMRCIKIKEHDFSTACGGGIFGYTRLQTGISPKDDRLGIFISKNKNYTWDQITSTQLKSALFGTENPSKEDISQYHSSRSCFFGYLESHQSCISFIHDAIAYSNAHLQNHSIDICLPGHRLLSYAADHSFDKLNLGTISHLWFNGTNCLKCVTHYGQGKHLRIIDPGLLSSKDFKIMMSVSAPIVGCRGDNSLALALSFGKIPCYENRFPEKANALLMRIEKRFTQNSPLYKYCASTVQDPLLRKAETASLPGLAEQAKQLGEFMREYANFKPILKGIVNERLLRQKDPDFADREDQLKTLYIQSKISTYELTTLFQALLSEKGLDS